MADGKFKIAGSTTGNYYVMKNGKRTYFDAHNKPMDENVFLKAENATIDRNNSMRKKEHVDAKSNLVKQYYPGSKTGRYYTVNPKTGQKTYYASNGHPIKESYWLQKEQEAVEAVKNKGKSKGTEKTEKKGFWGKLWDHAKSFGKGVVKSVTKAFTDENGKFSWKQTLKTIGTAAAVTVGAALLVGAEILTAGQVTWLIVGAGVAMGGTTIAKGAINYANANTYEEKLKATEEMGEGTGEIGQAILFKKGIKGQMSNAAAVGRTAKMEALASGSGRYVASLKGAGAGLKSMVPSPKQMWEGTKNGAKTAYDTVRHPVRTTKNIIEARRAKSWEKADIQEHVSGAKTHEDIAAARKQVNESEVLSAKQKAKYNKQLDKAAESATHEDLAALRKNATETAANPSAKKSEITKAQKEYENGIKRSVDRDALTTRRDEIVGDAYNRQAKIDEVAKLKEEELKLLVEQKVYARKHENAEILERYDNELIQGIKKSEIPEATKTKLLKDLEEVGVKPLSKESIVRLEEASMDGTPAGKELKAINARLKQIDKLQETEFNGLINKAEFKKGSWTSRQVKRIRGKKGEYETIEARIKAEVKNPELREQLLTKLKNKKQLLEDINNLKKHPKKGEYEDLIKRADDELSLDLIEKKLASDHHIINSRTSKAERSDLYRQIFAKKHSINPEKYPNIEAKLEAKQLDAKLKDARKELKRLETERDAASAEIDANKATSRSNTNEVINRNGRIEELKGQISKLESEVRELNSTKAETIVTRTTETNARQGAIEEMNTQSAVAEGYRGQEAYYSRQARVFRQKQEKLNTLNDEVSTLNKELVSQKQLFRNRQELNELSAQNKKYGTDINRLAKKYAEQAEQELSVVKQERAQHGQEIQRLNKEIRETETSIRTKESELQKARSEQGENSQRVQELQNEIKEISRGLPEKQAKLKELQEKYIKAEKKIKKLETAKRKNNEALEEAGTKEPKRGWGAIPTMIVATENVAHTADTLQTGVEALMALAAEDAQEEQQVTEDEQVAETEQETGDDVEQIGDAPEDEATATDEATSDTSTDTSNDSSTPVSDSATPATGTPSNTPVNGGNSSTPKAEDKKAEDKKVEDKTNTPATEEKKEEKPVTAEEPTVDNDNNSVNDITIKTYINGRDESGELRDITPAERLILTEQIQNAKNIDDVALIYSEMRSFNKFDGRRNLRRALKQKRKEIEGKHNNYYARMQRVNNDNATLNVTEADRLLAKTNESSTENLSNMSTVKKKFGMFRSPEYLLKSDNADIGVLNQGTPITDSPVINETNLFAPTDALAKENTAAPETTSEASLNVETTSISVESSVKNASDATSVEPSVENASDVTSVEPSVAQVKEETTASQTDMAQADIPDDEVKHKLDIDNGWGDLA